MASAAPVPANAGAADNVENWAWSGTIGWISLNCTNRATCASADYGVTIEDSETDPGWADIFGWAWSETMGWICFGKTCTATTPEGGASYANYRPIHVGKVDQFFGWAQVVALGDRGWISLNCENLGTCASSNYHLVLDTLTGNFTKGMFSDHYAWSGNDDGTGIGWIDFSLVTTTWTPADLGIIRRPEGVYEPDNPGLPGTHLTTFGIRFLQFSAAKDYQLQCTVRALDGSTRVLSKVMAATVRNGTERLDYTMSDSDPVGGRPWVLESCKLGSPPLPTTCAVDADCGFAKYCDTTISFCRYLADQRTGRRPIFTHSNTWTGLDAAQDQYLAIKCFAAFPGNYFNNAARCDYTGDATFSLAMRRGVPVEGDCGNGIDDDGNGQVDCADRYCQGISYLCQTLPRTTCTWGQSGDGIIDCSDPSYVQGDLCCTRQPVQESPPTPQHIVNGLECAYGDPNDGYFDCDCTTSVRFDSAPDDDCFSPGYQSGDLCCSVDDDVIKP